MKEGGFPDKVPPRGFYYHYKHDPSGPLNEFAYEVIGVGRHTEDDCPEEDMHMVIYRPLYDGIAYRAGKYFYVRPLGMFLESVTKHGRTTPRFSKITDQKILAALRAIRAEMYKD